jgi:hypothetical protein
MGVTNPLAPYSMGFDKNDSRPIVKPAKATTKVNISLIVGVLIFFIIGGAAIAWMRSIHG